MGLVELDQFNINDEQRAVVEAARKFADEVLRPAGEALDKLTPEEVIAEDSILWDVFRKYHADGFHRSNFLEPFGGLNLGAMVGSLVTEQMGRGDSGLTISLGVASLPFALAQIAADPEVQKLASDYCADTEGKMVGCWAGTEPDHGSDLLLYHGETAANPDMACSLRAELDGDEYVLNGQKAAWVSNGTIATHAAVWLSIDPSRGHQGGGIAIMSLDLPGVTRGKALDKIGQRPLNQGELFFDNVRIPKGWMIASDPDTYTALTDLQLAAANAGMSMIFTGLAQAAYDEAQAYAVERIQGGRPIVEHQNIKLKLFSMFAQLEAARSLSRRVVQYNAQAQEQMQLPVVHYPMAAKIVCTETAFKVASEAIQIFGGNGLSREYPVEKLFRDARASMIEDGVNETLALGGMDHLLQE